MPSRPGVRSPAPPLQALLAPQVARLVRPCPHNRQHVYLLRENTHSQDSTLASSLIMTIFSVSSEGLAQGGSQSMDKGNLDVVGSVVGGNHVCMTR